MKRQVPIRWRLTLWFSGLLLLALLGFSLLFYLTLQANLSTRIDDTLTLRAGQVQREFSDSPGQGLDSQGLIRKLQIGLLQELAEPGVYVQILDKQGNVQAGSPNLFGNRLPPDATSMLKAENGESNLNEVRVGRERLRVLSQPLRGNGQIIGVLQVAESLEPFYDTMTRVRIWLIVGSVLTLLLAAVGGWWLVRRALRPVVQVTATARKIAATRSFDERIPLKEVGKGRLDEIGELSATFNQMIEELGQVFEKNKHLMADTSHELRTPLTVIRGNLNLLRRGLVGQEAEEALAESEEEAIRLSRLVGDLLLLSQADAEQVVEHAPVQLDTVMARVLRRCEQLAQTQQKKLEIELERNDAVIVSGDEGRLFQVINNLAENAVRYTPENGKVTLRLEKQASKALISVKDSGIGIAAEHLPHLFERFYRVDKARSRALGGTGLGLAIVKYLSEAHGGTVQVESEVGKGTLFEIRLPLAP